jgi:AcrR family transcriptional regulator
MQDNPDRRSNATRRAEMRQRLIAEARAQFVQHGYSDTSTPDIVRAAGVTRGALYHHFADKLALFDAVVLAEAKALRRDIEAAAPGPDALAEGTRAFFEAMKVPGRARLLLIDGPAVLGVERMDAVDAGGGRQSLVEGLTAAAPDMPEPDRTALAQVLSAAFDRAALAVAGGAPKAPYLAAMLRLVAGATSPET